MLLSRTSSRNAADREGSLRQPYLESCQARKRRSSRKRSSQRVQQRRCANSSRRSPRSRKRRRTRSRLNRSEEEGVAEMRTRKILRSSVKMVSILIPTKHAMLTSLSLSLMRKTRAKMAIIDVEVVTLEVAEEAKEVETEAEITAAEVALVTTVETIVAITTKNVAPEARVEIQDNLETMKKITR